MGKLPSCQILDMPFITKLRLQLVYDIGRISTLYFLFNNKNIYQLSLRKLPNQTRQ